MTAAIVDADASITEPRGQLRKENWGPQVVTRGESTDVMPVGDRLAPARGAFLGIMVGAALWAMLLLFIVSHFTGRR